VDQNSVTNYWAQGGPIVNPADNPSNGLDINGLMQSLIGTAGGAYTANQQSQSSIAMSKAGIAPIYAAPWNPLVALGSGSGRMWLIIGGGILALALILRR